MNQVFLEYLEEAYAHTKLRNDHYKEYVKHLVELMLEIKLFAHEEILEELPNEISDYFENHFTRCDNPNCEEWTRNEDLHQARYDVEKSVCPQCREDGC